jgi:hypothetical protein
MLVIQLLSSHAWFFSGQEEIEDSSIRKETNKRPLTPCQEDMVRRRENDAERK